MSFDTTRRLTTITGPRMVLHRAAWLVGGALTAAAITARALTDLGLDELVDLAINGQWNLWLVVLYGVGALVSVPLVLAGWVAVMLHITRRKGHA